MIKMKPTTQLSGITIQGDYNDFSELVDSIYRMTREEVNGKDYYYGVKNRLLGLCYDIRHAYMGDREVILEDNGMTSEIMQWHNISAPTQSVYYSVNVLFPEAIFLALSLPHMYYFSARNYGTRSMKAEDEKPQNPYADFIRDKANLNVLCAGIWQALGMVIGDDELEKIIRLVGNSVEYYADYVTHYIDKCNIELLKTEAAKRPDKLKNITKRIIKKPQGYKNLEFDMNYWAKQYKTTIYALEHPDIQYPNSFEW